MFCNHIKNHHSLIHVQSFCTIQSLLKLNLLKFVRKLLIMVYLPTVKKSTERTRLSVVSTAGLFVQEKNKICCHLYMFAQTGTFINIRYISSL